MLNKEVGKTRMNELISIIVPIYKVEKYVRRCIDSIINQSYSNIEIILVDDGSPDESGLICDKYKKRDSRIKVIHKENEGLGFARNAGLDCATGKYVTFIDGDDYIGYKHIENMYRFIEETGADTCMAGHTKVYADKQVEHFNVCAGSVYKKNIKEHILPRMCGVDSQGNDYIEMSVCMVLFSNKIIQNNQLRFVSEREFVSEDLVFGFEYYPLSKGVCISDITDYYYCDNEDSLTTKYRGDRFESEVKLYKLLLDKAKVLNIENLCKIRLQNTVIAIARYSIKLEYKFAHVNGNETARCNVRKICDNYTLNMIFNEYNDRSLKLGSRIVNYLIKSKNLFLLKIIMMLKNKLSI